MRRLAWCAAALSALASCADPSSSPDPTATSRAITAREVNTSRAANGAVTERPVDLDASVVQAYVLGDDGTWTTYAGEGTSNGQLLVDGVPAGPAWLRVDYLDTSAEPRPHNEYFWIDGDADVALELGTWRVGRTDYKYAQTIPTDVDLQLSGLAPWQPGLDLAVIYSPNVDFVQVWSADGEGTSGVPTANATSSVLRSDWAGAVGGPLIDASRGDRAWMMQFRFREMNGVMVGAPVRAAELPAFTLADAETTAVPAALGTPAPLTVRLAMDRGAFDAVRADIGKTVSPALGRGFSISSSPSTVTTEFSPTSIPAELVVLDQEAINGLGKLDLGNLEVASPFAADTLFGHFASAYLVKVERDDGYVAQAFAEIGVITSTLPTEAAPAAPIIGPVRNVTIAGRPAFDAPQGVGAAPEIAWEAPAFGTPVEYEVKILAPGGVDPTYDFGWYPSAIFHVPGDRTSFVLPPETLVTDYPYAIAIRAITHAVPDEQRAVAPRQLALPYGWADTITPAFKP